MGSAREGVAIVGGSIAGGALALTLARAGLAVTVLEQSTSFHDKVLGETMPPWGYAGLVDVMVKADGAVATHDVRYGDTLPADVAESAAMDVSGVVDGMPARPRRLRQGRSPAWMGQLPHVRHLDRHALRRRGGAHR